MFMIIDSDNSSNRNTIKKVSMNDLMASRKKKRMNTHEMIMKEDVKKSEVRIYLPEDHKP